MNIMQVMKQAQDLQKKMKIAQEELSNMEVVGEAADGAAKVTCDGQGKFKSIKLSAEIFNAEHPEEVDQEYIEMVEDIVSAAILKANIEATKVMEEKMKSVTGGLNLNIPGLF